MRMITEMEEKEKKSGEPRNQLDFWSDMPALDLYNRLLVAWSMELRRFEKHKKDQKSIWQRMIFEKKSDRPALDCPVM